MSRIYLEEVTEWFRFTERSKLRGKGLLSIYIGDRDKTMLINFLNQELDLREFNRIESLDKHDPDEVRQTQFMPTVELIKSYLLEFDSISKI